MADPVASLVKSTLDLLVAQCVLTCDSQGVLKSSDSAKELWPDIFFNRPICPP